jgi:integrase/recombinase XerD
MATISLILRKDKPKKDGTMPLNFIIIKDRKKTKIATKIAIEPRFWDEKKSKIKPGAENSARLNAYLQKKLSELNGKVLEAETDTKSLSTKQLKTATFGVTPTNFIDFAKIVNQKFKDNGQISSYIKNTGILAKIQRYIGESSILNFQDITPDFLNKYEVHLKNKEGNSINTIHKDFRYIRKLFNDAYREELIEHQQIPFNRYKLKLEKTTREYLSEDELIQIENLELEDGTRMALHRDMFVFSSYTGGLRVSDILLLKWSAFDGSHLNIKIHKTGSQISIKLPSTALSIINKYKTSDIIKNSFVFPMLENDLDMKDPEALLKAVSSATAYINKNLKTIKKKLEIEKQISFHVSRHTWATRALKKGISIDKVSKLMGHAQIRETQIYAKIVSEELDKAMDVFNN